MTNFSEIKSILTNFLRITNISNNTSTQSVGKYAAAERFTKISKANILECMSSMFPRECTEKFHNIQHYNNKYKTIRSKIFYFYSISCKD